MRKLILIIIVLVLLPIHAYAYLEDIPFDYVTGKVIKVINKDRLSYVLLKTTKNTIWLVMGKTEFKVGKQYQFYPVYLEINNHRITGTKQIIDKLWYTHGVVDSKHNNMEGFSFNGISIGAKMSDVVLTLNELRSSSKLNDIVITNDGSVERVIVKDFLFGLDIVTVEFIGDIYGNLSSFSFVMSKPTNDFEELSILDSLNRFSNIFIEKYGKPSSCNTLNDLTRYSERKFHCSWSFGDIEIFTNYMYVNRISIVRATVSSQSRTVRTYNILEERIQRQTKKYVSDYEQLGVKEGASSF